MGEGAIAVAYLLFTDESGQDHQESPYEVLAGAAVHDSQLWDLVCDIQDEEGVRMNETKKKAMTARAQSSTGKASTSIFGTAHPVVKTLAVAGTCEDAHQQHRTCPGARVRNRLLEGVRATAKRTRAAR